MARQPEIELEKKEVNKVTRYKSYTFEKFEIKRTDSGGNSERKARHKIKAMFGEF